MQTFLPDPDFRTSAELLDVRRLGKQRVETLQVLRALHFDGYGWGTHPAVLMWQGFEDALVAYGLAVADAWTAQGRADTTRDQIAEFAAPSRPRTQGDLSAAGKLPPWLGQADLHRSHRSALLRKDPAYREHFPDDPDDLEYVWPPAPAGRRPAPGAVTAWLVRPPQEAAPDDPPRVLRVAVPDGSRRTKRLRELERWAGEVAVGDRVCIPDGSELLVGEVAGPPSHVRDHLERPVRWRGHFPRAALRRPWQLQDPGRVAPIHAEPRLRRV